MINVTFILNQVDTFPNCFVIKIIRIYSNETEI